MQILSLHAVNYINNREARKVVSTSDMEYLKTFSVVDYNELLVCTKAAAFCCITIVFALFNNVPVY